MIEWARFLGAIFEQWSSLQKLTQVESTEIVFHDFDLCFTSFQDDDHGSEPQVPKAGANTSPRTLFPRSL